MMEIDLSGPKGNAFYLLGVAKRLCKQVGEDSEPIISETQSGDYSHLLEVFKREFGDFVTFV